MPHFKGHFHTNYWAKFQIYAIIFLYFKFNAFKIMFCVKNGLNMKLAITQKSINQLQQRLLHEAVNLTRNPELKRFGLGLLNFLSKLSKLYGLL